MSHLRVQPGEFSPSLLEDGRPLVFPDLCRHWPALGKWSPGWFRERFADREVNVAGKALRFDHFLDQVEASTADRPSPYLRENFLSQYFPELLPDIEPLPADRWNRLNSRLLHGIAGYRRGAPDLLIAGAGTRFPVLHYDLHHLHAFITQVQGRKHFWLYPPDQSRCLYPLDDQPNISGIDDFDPGDLTRYPAYRQARCHELDLHPGETIFIPSGWWHRTAVPDTSIAVTWNLVNAANWTSFVDDCYFGRDRGQSVRGRVRRLRMSAVGAMLAIGHRLGTGPAA